MGSKGSRFSDDEFKRGGKKRIENRIGGRTVIRQGQREAEITRAVCGQHFWPPNAEVRIELSPSARTAAAACGTTTCRIFVRNNCGRLVTTLGQPAFYGQHSKATRSSLIFIVSCSISLIALASFNAPYAIHFPPPPSIFTQRPVRQSATY